MILRASFVLALGLSISTAHAQSTDYGSAGIIACTSPASELNGTKRANLIIADNSSKTVSMSVQSKNGYPTFRKSNAIVAIDNPMAPPPPPAVAPNPADSTGVTEVVPVTVKAEKPRKKKKKPAKPEPPVQVSKVITYDLQLPVTNSDPTPAKFVVDSEKGTATYIFGSDASSSETYPVCRAFAAGDYGAIYAWVKNQL